jgi:hypothetical protein
MSQINCRICSAAENLEKDRMKLLTLLLCCSLFAISFIGPSSEAASGKLAPRGATSSALTPASDFNLSDFGATGDGTTDDGPALQSALDALATAGGGTLFVPAGRYAINTPVHKDFKGLAASVSIVGVTSTTEVPPVNTFGDDLTRGLDLLSEFLPRTGEQAAAISISGLQSLLIRDVSFAGTPDIETDAAVTLVLADIAEAEIRHCEFYGLSSVVPGGSIILNVGSKLGVDQTVFLGSTANSGFNTPVIQNLSWKGVTVNRTIFADYGQRPDFYGKLGDSTPYSWIGVGDAAATGADSPRREVVIKDSFLDEGAVNGVTIIPQRFTASAKVDLVYISGIFMNVSNLQSSGTYISGVANVMIENSQFGWSHNADAAINLLEVGNAIVDRVKCLPEANRIRADWSTGKLSVVNSVYTYLDSESPNTCVITTSSEDDPAGYVREQFKMIAGREPDAAAHFYWSNRLLECAEEAICLANVKEALTAYLQTPPQPVFSISGTITDQNHAPLQNVLVSLTGSQTSVTTSDANGRYSFSVLGKGNYAVSPAKATYVFAPFARGFEQLSADQAADFEGTMQSLLEFSAATYTIAESERRIDVTLTRYGDTSGAAEVTYTGMDGSARQRSDVIPIIGRISFAPNEISKSFLVFITDDSIVEGNESLTISLSDLAGCTLGNNSTATLTIHDDDNGETSANPIDEAQFFVRQQYRDFLNRAPDADGLDYWAEQITNCGDDAVCVSEHRTNVSAAFFLSIEFQETGFLVYRLYKAAYATPPVHMGQFLLDTRAVGRGLVVGANGWKELLEVNKKALIEDFVERAEFIESYPSSLTPLEFVNQLNLKAGNVLTADETTLLALEFGGSTNSQDLAARARVMRLIAENQRLSARETNSAFVLMQYFGYLQRNPYDLPDSNLDGYLFWLQKLEEHRGDYQSADMVKSFLLSTEYRSRFGAP